MFDQFLEIHHPHLFSGGITLSNQTLSDSEKLQQIAEEINKSLLQREKFIVFLRLVEFINEDDVMTAKELAFIRTVADSFNISRVEHENTKKFVLSAFHEIEPDKILLIDRKKRPFVGGVKHIRDPFHIISDRLDVQRSELGRDALDGAAEQRHHGGG